MNHSLPSDFGGVATVAQQAHQLLAQLTSLTEEAIVTFTEGDSERGASLVQDRDPLLRKVDDLLNRLFEARDRFTTSNYAVALDALDHVLTEIRETARSAYASDRRLSLVLEAERDQIARELDRIDGENAVLSAYGRTRQDRATLNVVS